MGTPYTCVWNQFTIREIDDSLVWIGQGKSKLDEVLEGASLSNEAKVAYDILARPLPRKDFWFKRMWNINLPDINKGHALLLADGNRISLETFSKGYLFE